MKLFKPITAELKYEVRREKATFTQNTKQLLFLKNIYTYIFVRSFMKLRSYDLAIFFLEA